MFEKLKKLIFDESIELEPQEENDYFDLPDSLENNKNLIKTQPLNKTADPKPIEEPVVEPVVEPVQTSDHAFRRIDVQPEETQKPVVEPKIKVEKEVVKQVAPKTNKPKPAPKNPQYYKPRVVISPMFGVSQQENQRSQQIKTLTKPEEPSKDDKIISPMYGKVTAEQEIVTKQTKSPARKRKTPSMNMSLEEMLNMQSSDELEFTLFDVKVDKKEFQSRENKILDDSDNN